MLPILTPESTLPTDAEAATLVGRVFVPGIGPVVVTVREGRLFDVSSFAPTTSGLLEIDGVATQIAAASDLPPIAPLADVLAATPSGDEAAVRLLAPCDLQAIKAAGVTFVSSMLERVIEEQARGDPAKAESVRREIVNVIGDNLSRITPGSPEAAALKDVLIRQRAWSQYLEVGIGVDAEIFTKSQPMSAVGSGFDIGIHPKSEWNNPEPEVVLAVNSRGETIGAVLGNDVNLRDFEGRSALLLGKAKDNNGSCAIGPFIRLFDNRFSLDDVRDSVVSLRVEGDEGFVLDGSSSMAMISRDPLDLVGQAINANHQYPDGLLLFLGTMFAPTKDRRAPGQGFTHAIGDRVTIASPRLGALVNRVERSDRIPPWTFGARALMESLAARKAL